MLSINDCKQLLKNYNLTDKETEQLRNTLYCMTENIIDKYIRNEQSN